MAAATNWLPAAVDLVALGPALARWLRVAQREHYIPESASTFAIRWWGSSAMNAGLMVLGCAGIVFAAFWPLAALAAGVAGILGPVGLTIRGRTAPLRWTRRLRTLAAVTALVLGGVMVAGAAFGREAVVGAALVMGVPAAVDLACYISLPFESLLLKRHLRRAAARLAKVGLRIVAVTGSYGKTSTKLYVAHLLAGTRSTVATPGSYNNLAGLARTVNEQVGDGTEVLVAEMGAYRPGEIRELCNWFPPDVAVITAVGPVHLERFRTEERVLAAKSEIAEKAPVVVLQVDDKRLAALASALEASGKRVVRCSGGNPGGGLEGGREVRDTDVAVLVQEGTVQGTRGAQGESSSKLADGEPIRRYSVFVEGKLIGDGLAIEGSPSNVACAAGVAVAMGLSGQEIAGLAGSLPQPAHRLEVVASAGGCMVLDDTYNSNPAGCREALRRLGQVAGGSGRENGRVVVVTPGMVELGRIQAEENERFGKVAAEVATDLLVVGRTNRSALLAGARRAGAIGEAVGPSEGSGAPRATEHQAATAEARLGEDASDPGSGISHRQCRVRTVATRDDAVRWARENLGPGDVVLYENDLPDHYP